MKERGTMPHQQRFIQLPLIGKIFLGLLGGAYLVYLVALGHFLSPATPSIPISEHSIETNASAIIQNWTVADMRQAIDADSLIDQGANQTLGSTDTNQVQQGQQQEGQLPRDGESSYPLSTVGKVFFTNAYGQNMVCSGTAVVSTNKSVVDTAGHCLYWDGGWVRNVIFCPLYDNGNTPYGCWAARELEVPSDWIDASPNDLHHDFGIAVVSPNSQGTLTDLVGGAGWAYNQTISQPFYAYGYPAGYPFDGQTRKSCDTGSKGKSWQYAGGTVVSIPCDMTGGSSGGPWFIKINGNWYLNGHNDFTSTIQPGHMFSPYYDDTWYALYQKAQSA
jgi:V8-like Glu-specific endopeptidase